MASNYKHGDMDVRISELARFLRLNGEDVVKGNCKLSLTTSILCLLNNFDETIFPDNMIGTKFLEDIEFLLRFMKMTFHLKIIHGAYTLRGGVDLSKFTNLKIIELHKVPMHLIIGLNQLSSQIKVLICHRSICHLKEIFLNDSNDVCHEDNWSELKELNVANNYMDTFDKSLCMVPNVENFDASFNNLTSIEYIQVLEKLAFLNVSYNRIETIIGLDKMTSLKTLKIRNNVLEYLNGIENLVNLCEFDLRCNCLSEHSTLAPLRNLQFLEMLYLEGNPLFFHEKHRKLTTKYIHSSAIKNGIILDGELLSNIQDSITNSSSNEVTSKVKENLKFSSHTSDVSVHSEKTDDSTFINMQTETRANSVQNCDKISPHISEDFHSRINDESLANMKLKQKSMKMKHKCKERDVCILEPEYCSPIPSKRDLQGFSANETSSISPHYEIKDLLEKRRKELKESWLVPEDLIEVPPNSPVSNSEIKDLLEKRRKELKDSWLVPEDLIKVPPNSPASNSFMRIEKEPYIQLLQNEEEFSNLHKINFPHNNSPSQTVETFHNVGADGTSNEKTESTTEIESCLKDAPRLGKWIEEQNSLRLFSVPSLKSSKYGELSEPIEDFEELSRKEIELPYESGLSNQSLSETSSDSETETLCDEESNTFFAKKKENENFHSVIIKLQNFLLIELDSLSTRKMASLDLRSLLAILDAHQNKNEKSYLVALTFDVIKASDRKRCYLFDDKESAESFMEKIRPYAEAKAIRDFSMDALKCLKCQSQFSKTAAQLEAIKAENPYQLVESETIEFARKDYREEADACPNCGSTIVVQLDSLSVPCIESTKRSDYKKSSEKKNFSSEDESSSFSTSSAIVKKGRISDVKLCSTLKSSSILNLKQEPCTISQKEYSSKVDESHHSSKIENKEFESDMKHKVIENFNAFDLMKQKEVLSPDIFISLDHRLKLFFEEYVFKADEKFEACLETDFVLLSKCKEFHGFIIISTERIFMLDKSKKNMDLCDESIKITIPLKSLSSMSVLLGNQGFAMAAKPNDEVVLCLIKDTDLCKCFISFLADIIKKILQDLDIQKFYISTENAMMLQVHDEVIKPFYQNIESDCEKPEILLYMYAHCNVEGKTDRVQVCIIVTVDHIFLTSLQFQKLVKGTDTQKFLCHNLLEAHKITDLIKINLCENLMKIELCFEDEDGNCFNSWKITTQRNNSSISLISALKKPWETIFGTDLTLNFIQ